MASSPSLSVTELLLAWGGGEGAALQKLVPLIYRELRQIARRSMVGERAGNTLQATALVNEAYLKLIDCRRVRWQNRAHFFALSAQLMRRILVDRARARNYQKRGGGQQEVTFDEGLVVSPQRGRDILALDGALKALAVTDARKSRVVELRFFGGLGVEETAEVLKISPETVMRDWKMAKAWLAREMENTGKDGRVRHETGNQA